MSAKFVAPYPHEGACPHCRAIRVCNACGKSIKTDAGRCTNGRCTSCHSTVCWNAGPQVHGFGTIRGSAHFRIDL